MLLRVVFLTCIHLISPPLFHLLLVLLFVLLFLSTSFCFSLLEVRKRMANRETSSTGARVASLSVDVAPPTGMVEARV